MKDYCTCFECGNLVSDPDYIRYGGLCKACYMKMRREKRKKRTAHKA